MPGKRSKVYAVPTAQINSLKGCVCKIFSGQLPESRL